MSAERIRVGELMTVYKRGKVYHVDFHHRGHRRKTLKTTNLKVARRRAVALERRLQAGEFGEAVKDASIHACVQQYLAHVKSERAARTFTKYQGVLSTFERFLRGRRVTQPRDVTAHVLDAYRAFRLADRRETTVAHESVLIKQLFKFARSRGLIHQNPIAEYRVLDVESEKPSVPTTDELRLIMQASDHAEILRLFSMTGMRFGEIQALEKSDIDLKHGFIHVQRQVDGKPLKTKHSRRRIPIHDRLKPVLERLLKQDEHRLLLTAAPSEKHPKGGGPVKEERMLLRLKAACKKAGLREFTLHALRHHFATVATNARVPVEYRNAWMGHRDRSMARHYLDLQDEVSKKFINVVNFDYLFGEQSPKKESA